MSPSRRDREPEFFGQPDPDPDDQGYEPEAEADEDLDYDETAAPEAPEEESIVAPFRRIGCSWPFLLGVVGVLALIAGTFWGLREITRKGWTPQLKSTFQEVNPSLLPAPRVQTIEPDWQLQLFYIVRDRALTGHVRRLRRPTGSDERARHILRDLINPAGLFPSPLPAGTQLRGVYIQNGIALVDLSKEFSNPPRRSPQLERLTVYTIVNSLLLNDQNINGVRLYIEGQPVKTAWGWMDLSSPLGPDISLIH